MNKTTGLLSACMLALAATAAYGQAYKEYYWIPSGKLVVGDDSSEADARYACDIGAPAARIELSYLSGKKVIASGRQVKQEKFRLTIAGYRAGPIPGALVIGRRWDTSVGAAALKIKVDDADLPAWNIPAFEGQRRWADILYAVPLKAICGPDGKTPKAQVTMTISSDAPTPSYGYAFFITRDWEVLGQEPQGAIVVQKGDDPKVAYLSGVAALAQTDHAQATQAFQKAAKAAGEPGYMARRMLRLVEFRKAAETLKVEMKPECFRAHYLLGLYASGNGFWEDALDEFNKAVTCDPAQADATYHLAEAMAYNRMPPEAWAPVMERAGTLYNRPHTHVEDVLMAINTRAVKDICGRISLADLATLYHDWRVVEQATYGASRGAWKMRTTYRTWGPGTSDWIMQAGWIFAPPDSDIPVRGMYDYTVSTAGYGASSTGGVDCGPAGSGCSQVGPTRGWEVLLHEWNHAFDWVSICGEQVPGYPVTHDSDGCGKQPLVNMGWGHLGSMHYYVDPAQYRRHEAASPELPGNHIKVWGLAELTSLEPSGELEAWLVKSGWMKSKEMLAPGGWTEAPDIDTLKKEWAAERQKDATDPKHKTPDWPEYLRTCWNGVKILERVASPKEAALLTSPAAVKWRRFTSRAEFVDLLQAFPKAPDKCVAYAQTFIYSPRKQETRLWLGYNPVMAVWLNGRKIHEGHYGACAKWDNASRTDMVANTAKLDEGWNRLVCKIERGGRGWGFSVGLTTFDNAPVGGLKYQVAVPNKLVPLYEPPQVGVHYRWDQVKDDYVELLPALGESDLRKITGIADLKTTPDMFLLKAPSAPAGSRVVPQSDPNDHQLNNFLNWDYEALAAIRYTKDGKTRDLLLIRPEYFEEYLELLKEAPSDLVGPAKDRVLGTLVIRSPAYPTTPNRFGSRYVLAVETCLGDYPVDEQDLLDLKTKP